MASQEFNQTITEFAEFVGMKDKEILELIDQKITQLKSDLLGGDVAADLDTLRELADAVRNLKSGETMPEKLIQKITEFKSSLDGVAGKMTTLENLDLITAYNKGKQGQ